MSKVYWEYTGETRVEFGVELKQIRAACDFGFVEKGDLGGWIGGAVVIAQNGLAWIGKNAKAFCGTIEGGTIRGGDFLTVSPIGSENGQFTAEITENGEMICNRGCFSGTLDEFESAVQETHGESNTAREYKLVIELVRIRLGPIAAKRKFLSDVKKAA